MGIVIVGNKLSKQEFTEAKEITRLR